MSKSDVGPRESMVNAARGYCWPALLIALSDRWIPKRDVSTPKPVSVGRSAFGGMKGSGYSRRAEAGLWSSNSARNGGRADSAEHPFWSQNELDQPLPRSGTGVT
jgi:hypothetical protein